MRLNGRFNSAVIALGALLLGACAVAPRHTAQAPADIPATTSRNSPSAVPACQSDQLQLARAGNDAGMGHRMFAFRYTNSSSSTCMLGGYPQVLALDANHDVISAISVTHATHGYLVPNGTSAHAQVLAPEKSLWFVITWSVIPTGNTPCPGMAAIRITPPDRANGADNSQALPAAATSTTGNPVVGADAGTTLPQVSPVCQGLQVLPLRTAPKDAHQ